jgi:transcriptional regulator GlxA family with amidase domain
LQRIGVVTFSGFHVMGFAALSVFEVANSEFDERRHDVHFISETGGPVRTSAGLIVANEPFDDSVFDTLIIFTAVCSRTWLSHRRSRSYLPMQRRS